MCGHWCQQIQHLFHLWLLCCIAWKLLVSIKISITLIVTALPFPMLHFQLNLFELRHKALLLENLWTNSTKGSTNFVCKDISEVIAPLCSNSDTHNDSNPKGCPFLLPLTHRSHNPMSTPVCPLEVPFWSMQVSRTRGGQSFHKSMKFRNSLEFLPFLAVRFRTFSPWSLNRFPSSFSSSHNVLTYWEVNSGWVRNPCRNQPWIVGFQRQFAPTTDSKSPYMQNWWIVPPTSNFLIIRILDDTFLVMAALTATKCIAPTNNKAICLVNIKSN